MTTWGDFFAGVQAAFEGLGLPAIIAALGAGLYEVASLARSTRTFRRKKFRWFLFKWPVWAYLGTHTAFGLIFLILGFPLLLKLFSLVVFGEGSHPPLTILADPPRTAFFSSLLYLSLVAEMRVWTKREGDKDVAIGSKFFFDRFLKSPLERKLRDFADKDQARKTSKSHKYLAAECGRNYPGTPAAIRWAAENAWHAYMVGLEPDIERDRLHARYHRDKRELRGGVITEAQFTISVLDALTRNTDSFGETKVLLDNGIVAAAQGDGGS